MFKYACTGIAKKRRDSAEPIGAGAGGADCDRGHVPDPKDTDGRWEQGRDGCGAETGGHGVGKSGAFSASWEVNVGRGGDKSAQPTLRSQASLDHRALREVTLPPPTSELDEGNTRKDL